MIVTCPECSTRYSVDASAIGPHGRKVRCVKCGHSWTESPPEDLPRPVAPAPLGAAGTAEEGEAARRRTTGRRERPRVVGERGGGSAWLAWLLLLVVVGGAAGGAVAFQAEMVRLWPSAKHLYALAGLAPKPIGYGLALRNVTSKEATEDDARVLRVSGEIVNTTDEVRDVPPLRGVLLDHAERELQRWTFQASESRLLPGEVVSFESEIRDPSPDAARLTIVFDERG